VPGSAGRLSVSGRPSLCAEVTRTLSVIAVVRSERSRPDGPADQFRIGITQRGGRFVSCRYTRYAQTEPVVSNTRQKNSGVHVISTAPLHSPCAAFSEAPREQPSRVAVQIGHSIA